MLLDQRCKPWLLEVNHSPSFSVGSPVDAAVKEAVLLDTLRMVRRVHMFSHRGLRTQTDQCYDDICHHMWIASSQGQECVIWLCQEGTGVILFL